MIKGISQSGRYMVVSGGSATNYINNYSGAQGVGNVRFNTTNQNLEVYDGNNWQMLQMNFASVGLTGEAESLLDWAREERNKQLEYASLAKDHPAVKIAIENLEKAKQQLRVTATLSKDTYETGVAEQSQPMAMTGP